MVLYQQVATRRCDLLVPRSTQDSRTVSLIMTCAFDEVAAPHAHFHSSCYKFVGLAATLRECISLCGPDAAPVCPTSDDENDFVWSVARSGRYVESIWLGWHKNESGSLSSCVSEGADAEYALARAPTSELAPCIARGSSQLSVSQWEASACDLRPYYQNGCVCGSSHNVSVTDDVLSRLEAPSQAVLTEYFASVHQQVILTFSIAAVVWSIPIILLLCWLLYARFRRSSPKTEPSAAASRRKSESSDQPLTTQGETRHRLAAARRALASTRLRISGGMLLGGWTLLIFGVTPIIAPLVFGLDFSPILGPALSTLGPVWTSIPSWLGMSLLLLAVMAVDALAIRLVCWIAMAIPLGFFLFNVPNDIRRARTGSELLETLIHQITYVGVGLVHLPTLCWPSCCLEAQNQALEAKLDRVLGAVAV